MSSAGSNALDRARGDIAEARLWKARDRLAMLVKREPTNQEALDLLGEVYFRMGDLPAAGRFWILTDRSGPEAAAALAALDERWGASLGELLNMVRVSGPIEAYPDDAQERIRGLRERALVAGIDWRRGPAVDGEDDDDYAGPSFTRRERVWLAGLAVVGPGLWLLGAGTALYLLIRLVS